MLAEEPTNEQHNASATGVPSLFSLSPPTTLALSLSLSSGSAAAFVIVRWMAVQLASFC